MTDKLTKLYMSGVTAIYLMFVVGGGTLLAVIFCEMYGVDFAFQTAAMGLVILSIMFYFHLTALKKRMYDMQYEKTIVPEEEQLKNLIEEAIEDEQYDGTTSNISDLDDNDNYV